MRDELKRREKKNENVKQIKYNLETLDMLLPVIKATLLLTIRSNYTDISEKLMAYNNVFQLVRGDIKACVEDGIDLDEVFDLEALSEDYCKCFALCKEVTLLMV